MSISMAKVLWQKRHDESQIKNQFGSNSQFSLEKMIKKTISSELKKVVGANKALVPDVNRKPIVINEDSDGKVNLNSSVKKGVFSFFKRKIYINEIYYYYYLAFFLIYVF